MELCHCDYHSTVSSWAIDEAIEALPFWTRDEKFCAIIKDSDEDLSEEFPDGNKDDPITIDPISLAADFYLLEAANHGVLGENDSETFATEAQEKFIDLVEFATPLIHNYLWYAVVSELTYYSELGKVISTGSWSNARRGWQKLIDHYGEELACDWAIEMFEKPGMWSSGYGGKPWADIVRVLRYKTIGKIGKKPFSDAMFLDRTFSLQHNSCTVFNKRSWEYTNAWGSTIDQMTCRCHTKPECGCENVLNWHASGDFAGLLAVATPEIAAFVIKIWDDSGYGKIEKKESPFCKKGCGSLKDSGDWCFYHQPWTCKGCGTQGTQQENYSGGKCYSCYLKKNTSYGNPSSITKTGFGTKWCWGCDTTLEKESSKATGFCTGCRSKYGNTNFNQADFYASSEHAWQIPDCGILDCQLCGYSAKATKAWKAYKKFTAKDSATISPEALEAASQTVGSFQELLNKAQKYI